MTITINDPEPIINLTVITQPPINVSVVQGGETKVVQVQPATLQGAKGDSPDRSIYSKREITATSSLLEIDVSLATTFVVTLQTDVEISITGWPADGKTQRVALYFKQDEVGNRKITAWPLNTKWSFGEYPVLTSAPNAIDCVVIDSFDRGDSIFGGIVGIAYA
jgi:hypothetical protein